MTGLSSIQTSVICGGLSKAAFLSLRRFRIANLLRLASYETSRLSLHLDTNSMECEISCLFVLRLYMSLFDGAHNAPSCTPELLNPPWLFDEFLRELSSECVVDLSNTQMNTCVISLAP